MRAEVLGWGVASEGQLGIRPSGGHDDGFVRVPEYVVGAPRDERGEAAMQIACGERHSVWLAADGKMWSCGGNESGQLGRGKRGPGSFTIYPVTFTGGTKIVQVACGREHSVAVSQDGRVFSWGANEKGQLGMPSSMQFVDAPKRVPSLLEVVQVAAGPDHCIALTECGRVYVWGEQADGMCVHTPQEVIELAGVPIVRVAAGGRHCVALSASGGVFTWGGNAYGQLGCGDFHPRAHPVYLEGVSEMKGVEVAAGDAHTCILTKDGRVFVCGSDSFGQLGRGRKVENQTTPAVVTELMGSYVSKIACGRCHTLAVVAGRLWSFGLNSSGQLGNGLSCNQLAPRQIDELDHVRTVFAGWDQSFVVRTVFAGWDQSFVVRAAGFPDPAAGPNVAVRVPRFLVKKTVEELLAKRDKLELICELESVFSSLSSINSSFLYGDKRRYLGGGNKESGVCLDDAMDMFNALAASTDHTQYSELIVRTCLPMSVFCGDFDPAAYPSSECVRALLMLPWLDWFTAVPEKSVVQELHVPYAQAIERLKPKYRKCLESWWSCLPIRHFNRTVSALVSGVRRVVKDKDDHPRVLPLLRVLASLNEINRKRALIPLENFYVEELGESFDLASDYAYWRMSIGEQKAFHWADYPFIMNGMAKGELLSVEAKIQMQESIESGTLNLFGMNLLVEEPYFNLTVRRQHIVNDTIAHLHTAATRANMFSKPLRVTFMGEEGEDAGGVRKEFFMLLFQELLKPDFGMFVENDESHLVWFSGAPGEETSYTVVGLLCGLAVYNQVLVAFPFPVALYKMLLDQEPTLDDVCELSPTEGRSLQQLLDYEGSDVEDVFCLDFTISHTVFGDTTTHELKRGGADTPVTAANRAEYVKLYVAARMREGAGGEIKQQCKWFSNGFRHVLHSRVLNFFQPKELMELCVGNENYDWSEFKKVTEYKGVYHAKHPTIVAFWDAFFELSEDERKTFLKFLSGSTRLPVQGMRAMKAVIQPTDEKLLPVAHTCFNLLDLPNVADRAELLKRIRISIQHNEGFSLV